MNNPKRWKTRWKNLKQKYNEEFDGTELCACCNKEFDYVVNPVKSMGIKCTHCGEIQYACSLCSGDRCGDFPTCEMTTLVVLDEYNSKVK